MSGFPILDLILGVIFIYFLLSIISSSIVEIVMTIKRTRAQVLTDWLLQIFDTRITNASGQLVKLGQEIMDHCALTALSKPRSAPSYIDAKNFTTALLDKIILHSTTQQPTTIKDIIAALTSTTALSSELRQTFLLYAREAEETFNALSVKTAGAMEMFRSRLENWYDTNMDRISGTMKAKYTRRFTMITAIVTTLVLNADTIAISKYLYKNDKTRTQLAEKAYATGTDPRIKAQMDSLRTAILNDTLNTTSGIQQAGQSNQTVKIQNLNELQSRIDSTMNVLRSAHAALQESVPIGWNNTVFYGLQKAGDWILFWILKLAGLALTAFAIMMGAPFWFDVLNKVSNLRGTGPKPASTTDSNFNKPNR